MDRSIGSPNPKLRAWQWRNAIVCSNRHAEVAWWRMHGCYEHCWQSYGQLQSAAPTVVLSMNTIDLDHSYFFKQVALVTYSYPFFLSTLASIQMLNRSSIWIVSFKFFLLLWISLGLMLKKLPVSITFNLVNKLLDSWDASFTKNCTQVTSSWPFLTYVVAGLISSFSRILMHLDGSMLEVCETVTRTRCTMPSDLISLRFEITGATLVSFI